MTMRHVHVLQSLLVATLFVVSSYQQSCSISNNQDINQPNLSVVRGQLSNCCDFCRKTPNCKGFAWNNFEGGTCWLKAASGPLIAKNGVNAGIVSGGGTPSGSLITFNEFTNAVVQSNGYPPPSQAQYNSFIQGLPRGQITTKQEAAMALAQFLHESDGLRAKEEYRCRNNGCPGEYATPGCDASGQRYFGRGYIQLTWCTNYRAASQDLYGDNRLVSNPSLVATNENTAWDTAFWFWKVNVHNRAGISEGRFGVSTRAINGNLECDNVGGQSIARHRYDMYVRVRAAFGLPGRGDERGCYN